MVRQGIEKYEPSRLNSLDAKRQLWKTPKPSCKYTNNRQGDLHWASCNRTLKTILSFANHVRGHERRNLYWNMWGVAVDIMKKQLSSE